MNDLLSIALIVACLVLTFGMIAGCAQLMPPSTRSKP